MDVPCVSCGYNLRGLAVDATCPECGADVRWTVEGGRQAARAKRDAELRGREQPPLKLSWIKRRQRRATMLVLPLMSIWVASIFAVISLVRPLIVRSDWWGLIVILWMFVSFGLFGWGWVRIHRLFGLRCPYCQTTFLILDLKDDPRDPEAAREEDRRCSRCHAVMVDMDR